MEYIPESLRKKYEYDRDHHWMKWLEINAEIADKYCCRSYLCCSFEELIINLLYPQEGDTEALRAAEYNRDGFVPILLRGVVIENALDRDGRRFLQIISAEKSKHLDAETMLTYRNTLQIQNSIHARELYSDRSEYSIGNVQQIRPGTKVIIAATCLSISKSNEHWITVRYTDIAPDLDSDYTFVDKHYRIHQSEREYLMLYEQLANAQKGKRSAKYNRNTAPSPTGGGNQDRQSVKAPLFWQVVKWSVVILILGSLLSECAANIYSLKSPPQGSEEGPIQMLTPTEPDKTDTEVEFIQPVTEEVIPETTQAVNNTIETNHIEQTQPIIAETTPNTLTGSVIRSAGELNIRSGAGTNYGAIGRLNSGDAVTIYEQKNVNGVTWGNIGYGWVSMQYIELNDGSGTTPVYSGSYPTATANAEFLGEWISNDGYWHMSISQSGNGVKISAEHHLNESNKTTWEMYGEYDEHTAIRYWSGIRMDHDIHSGNIKYTSGEGAIVLNGYQLNWHESMEGPGDLMTFRRLDGQYTPPYGQNPANNNTTNPTENNSQNVPANTDPHLPVYHNTTYQNIADMSCDEMDMRSQYAIDFFNDNSDSIFRAVRRIVFSKAKKEISSEISESDDREVSVIITQIQRTTSRTDAVIVQAEGMFEGKPYSTEIEIYWWWENASIASNCLSFGWK